MPQPDRDMLAQGEGEHRKKCEDGTSVGQKQRWVRSCKRLRRDLLAESYREYKGKDVPKHEMMKKFLCGAAVYDKGERYSDVFIQDDGEFDRTQQRKYCVHLSNIMDVLSTTAMDKIVQLEPSEAEKEEDERSNTNDGFEDMVLPIMVPEIVLVEPETNRVPLSTTERQQIFRDRYEVYNSLPSLCRPETLKSRANQEPLDMVPEVNFENNRVQVIMPYEPMVPDEGGKRGSEGGNGEDSKDQEILLVKLMKALYLGGAVLSNQAINMAYSVRNWWYREWVSIDEIEGVINFVKWNALNDEEKLTHVVISLFRRGHDKSTKCAALADEQTPEFWNVLNNALCSIKYSSKYHIRSTMTQDTIPTQDFAHLVQRTTEQLNLDQFWDKLRRLDITVPGDAWYKAPGWVRVAYALYAGYLGGTDLTLRDIVEVMDRIVDPKDITKWITVLSDENKRRALFEDYLEQYRSTQKQTSTQNAGLTGDTVDYMKRLYSTWMQKWVEEQGTETVSPIHPMYPYLRQVTDLLSTGKTVEMLHAHRAMFLQHHNSLNGRIVVETILQSPIISYATTMFVSRPRRCQGIVVGLEMGMGKTLTAWFIASALNVKLDSQCWFIAPDEPLVTQGYGEWKSKIADYAWIADSIRRGSSEGARPGLTMAPNFNYPSQQTSGGMTIKLMQPRLIKLLFSAMRERQWFQQPRDAHHSRMEHLWKSKVASRYGQDYSSLHWIANRVIIWDETPKMLNTPYSRRMVMLLDILAYLLTTQTLLEDDDSDLESLAFRLVMLTATPTEKGATGFMELMLLATSFVRSNTPERRVVMERFLKNTPGELWKPLADVMLTMPNQTFHSQAYAMDEDSRLVSTYFQEVLSYDGDAMRIPTSTASNAMDLKALGQSLCGFYVFAEGTLLPTNMLGNLPAIKIYPSKQSDTVYHTPSVTIDLRRCDTKDAKKFERCIQQGLLLTRKDAKDASVAVRAPAQVNAILAYRDPNVMCNLVCRSLGNLIAEVDAADRTQFGQTYKWAILFPMEAAGDGITGGKVVAAALTSYAKDVFGDKRYDLLMPEQALKVHTDLHRLETMSKSGDLGGLEQEFRKEFGRGVDSGISAGEIAKLVAAKRYGKGGNNATVVVMDEAKIGESKTRTITPQKQQELFQNLYNHQYNMDGSIARIAAFRVTHGLNLINVRHFVLVILDNNPKVLKQMLGRTVRYCAGKTVPWQRFQTGQKKHVVYIHVIQPLAMVNQEKYSLHRLVFADDSSSVSATTSLVSSSVSNWLSDQAVTQLMLENNIAASLYESSGDDHNSSSYLAPKMVEHANQRQGKRMSKTEVERVIASMSTSALKPKPKAKPKANKPKPKPKTPKKK